MFFPLSPRSVLKHLFHASAPLPQAHTALSMPLSVRAPDTSKSKIALPPLSNGNVGHAVNPGTSPEAPPLSPLSPSTRQTKLTKRPETHESQAPIDRPSSKPFTDDSTDALALKAAISSLQIQKQKAERDIRSLREIKQQAVADPDAFQKHIAALAQPHKGTGHDAAVSEVPDSQVQTSSFDNGYSSNQDFSDIPRPQEIVRCPPVNWAKYDIVGQPLDRIHRSQQLRPGDHTGTKQVQREQTIATPYDALYDSMDAQEQGSLTRKDSHASPNDMKFKNTF